jgi:hypothetical protein
MHLRFFSAFAIAVLALTGLTTTASAQNGKHRPDTVDLPAGFQGEGVATGRGNTFYAGSRVDGRVARGDIREGTSEVFVAAPLVAQAVGLKADLRHDLLWVAGGDTGKAAVYELRTGAPVIALTLTTGPSFINDVTVTRTAAYFTNSMVPELYRVPVARDGTVGAPETIPLSGPAADFVAGEFNLNGIAATQNGKTLIVVNSVKGELYTVNPQTGASTLIDLGGASVPTGDGILLSGRTLFVVQNGTVPGVPNQIVLIRLGHGFSEGKIVDTLTSPLFETATTVARRGDVLLAVNAQFAGAPVDPEAEVVLLPLHGN